MRCPQGAVLKFGDALVCTITAARRWYHLRHTHGFKVKDIPPAPSSSAASESHKEHKELKWQKLLSLIKNKGWPGIHSHPGTLTPNGSGVPFQCTACNKVCKWPGVGICSKARRSVKPIPSKKDRVATWNSWLKIAIAFAKAAALKLRKARKPAATLAYAQAKQRTRNWSGASTQQIRKLHSGLPCVAASGSGDWWKCQWCDFTIPQSSASSSRSSKRKRSSPKKSWSF